LGAATRHRLLKSAAAAAVAIGVFAPLGPVSGPLLGVAEAQATALLLRLKQRSEGGRRAFRSDNLQINAVWTALDKAVKQDGATLDLDLIEAMRVEKRVWHYGSQEKALQILADYGDEIYAAHHATGVQPSLIVTVIGVESGGNPRAVSPVGAQGLMQLMPETGRRFGVTNPFDPAQNVMGGARYLAFLLNLFDGDHVLALAGYNAGEHRIEEYKGVPPFDETRGYLIKAAAFIDDARVASRTEGARSPLPKMRPVGLASMTSDERAAVVAAPVVTQTTGGFDYWMEPLN